jgi:hypothetical protein
MTALSKGSPPLATPDPAGLTCVRCGAPLPRLSRRKDPVCRVCATQDAQSFLRDALTNRRRRERDQDRAPED